MTRLNQIIAVANGKKTSVEKKLTECYHTIQKPDLFVGMTRTYQPLEDNGETLPAESKLPQVDALSLIDDVNGVLVDLFNVVSTQDFSNTLAKADVKIDGKVLIKEVPVTHLLFLEKQLTDVRTFISKLPTLDPAEKWTFDDNSSMYRTECVKTNRNVKKPYAFVKAQATDKFAAQVDVFNEDKKVGEYNTIKFSTCLPVEYKKECLDRVESLIDAVKFAREEANCLEVSNVKIGQVLLDFVFKS